MLSDNFVRGITLELLRPEIPGPDSSLWIKHEDGIIAHGLDHALVTVLIRTRLGRHALFEAPFRALVRNSAGPELRKEEMDSFNWICSMSLICFKSGRSSLKSSASRFSSMAILMAAHTQRTSSTSIGAE